MLVSGNKNGRLDITTNGEISFIPYEDISTDTGINIHYTYF